MPVASNMTAPATGPTESPAVMPASGQQAVAGKQTGRKQQLDMSEVKTKRDKHVYNH
jgi:hypothetical protein